MLPADGGYQQMGPGMAGGNDVHVSVGAGIGVGRGYVVAEEQTGPSTVTDTYTVVGDSKPMNKTPLYVCLGVVALLVVYLVAASGASAVHVTATAHRWRFEVHTDVFTVLHQGNWQTRIPFDSYNRMCSVRQSGTSRHCVRTISGTCAQTCHNRHTTRQTQHCSTSNGVQHCQTVSTPVTQRVCNTVYQYVNNYDTWCDYWVNRWAPQATAISSGVGLAPYWPYAPITNCGMLGCTRVNPNHPTSQHFMVDFNINDGSSAGSTDTCDFPAPGMWGWLTDGSQYQAQATNFGSDLICNSLQDLQAAPPPPNFQFVPDGGNSTDVLPLAPEHMPTAAPGPQYASGGQFTGSVPEPAPSPPPAFLAAEEPEITELDTAELEEIALGETTE